MLLYPSLNCPNIFAMNKSCVYLTIRKKRGVVLNIHFGSHFTWALMHVHPRRRVHVFWDPKTVSKCDVVHQEKMGKRKVMSLPTHRWGNVLENSSRKQLGSFS